MKSILIKFDNETAETALIEDGRLIELLIDDRRKKSIVGNIYVGVVKNVMKNNYAFVDIGEEKNVFLDLGDSRELLFLGTDNLKPNDNILIQILRNETGDKGAAATCQISVSDNYIVLLKSAYENYSNVGVSKKIENVSERKRLKKIATDILPDGFEVIIRTECEGISEEEMAEKINELITKYHQIVKRAEFSTAPAAIQKDDYFLANTLRAVLTSDVEKIVIDNEAEFSDVKDAALKIRDVDIKLYTGGIPIFSEHFLTKQIEEAFSRKVWLKSGGFIVIDHAEAGILIDVNSGKFVGKCSQQKTALKVDREALVEIAKQIRLRNLSGMILIDFIDLRFEENRCIIIDELEKELKKDRIPTSIIGMMGQGLVMLTRRKTREPIIGV